MRVNAIVATDASGVIGVAGALPWHIPDDLKKFKELTMGKPIIMGRKTHESIGKALPGRTNVIISRRHKAGVYEAGQNGDSAYRVLFANDLEKALAWLEFVGNSEVFVIGGEAIFKAAEEYIDRIYMSVVREPVKMTGKGPVSKWPIKCPGNDWSVVEYDQSHKLFASLILERRIQHVGS